MMLRDYHVEIFSTLEIVFYIATRRSKIASRATGRYAATSFDQLLVCPRSWFAIVGVAFFFCPPRLFPVFDRLASLDRPSLLRFPKKVMKKVFTHNLNTLSVYPAIQSNYTEVLGLLVRDFFSILFFFGFFSLPTDRPKIRERIRQQTKKVNGLRGSTSKQHTINLVPRFFSIAWEGKRPWDQGEHTGIYVLGQYSKRYRASLVLQVKLKFFFFF